jgi:hypothetical protein
LDLKSGDRVGDYIVRGRLGSGGYGAVYRVEQASSGEARALKALHVELLSTPNAVDRFEREIEVIRRIRHPGVVDIESSGRLEDGCPYFVMELLSGTSLETHIRSRRRLPVEEILAILEPLCGALATVHAQDIVHRDLKASNVFLCGEGAERRVVLLDFGVAKLLDADAKGLTTPSHIVGTASCMAPEQIRGEPATPRTDIYALGVLTFLMLTGQPPFEDPSFLLMQSMHLYVSPAKPSATAPISAAFDDVVLCALSKVAERRHADALAFFAAFREAAERDRAKSPPAAERRVLAFHLEVRADDEALDAPDDALFSDMEAILPFASEVLAARGFEIVLRTGNSLLAGLALPGAPEEERAARLDAIAATGALYRALARRPTLDPRVRVSICLHAGTAPPASTSLIDGDLLELATWVLEDAPSGVFASPEALADLSTATGTTGSAGRLKRIDAAAVATLPPPPGAPD